MRDPKKYIWTPGDISMLRDDYDPDEPRDEHGRWSESGGGGSSAKEARSPKEQGLSKGPATHLGRPVTVLTMRKHVERRYQGEEGEKGQFGTPYPTGTPLVQIRGEGDPDRGRLVPLHEVIPSSDSGAAHRAARDLLQQSRDIHDALAQFKHTHVPATLHTEHGDLPSRDVERALRSLLPTPFAENGHDLVTVHHSTTREHAERILREGVIPAAKPSNLARENYLAGKETAFAPGKGLSGGMYVGAPGTTTGFGRHTLELRVPRRALAIPPELHGIETDVAKALHTEHGAVVTVPVHPSHIKLLEH